MPPAVPPRDWFARLGPDPASRTAARRANSRLPVVASPVTYDKWRDFLSLRSTDHSSEYAGERDRSAAPHCRTGVGARPEIKAYSGPMPVPLIRRLGAGFKPGRPDCGELAAWRETRLR